MTPSRSITRLRDDENQRRAWLASRPQGQVPIYPLSALGAHHGLGTYVDTYYSPILGPTSTAIYKRFVTWVDLDGPGIVDLSDLALSLGIKGSDKGSVASPHSVIIRSLDRLCRHGLTVIDNRRAALGISVWLPALSPRSVDRLPEPLRRAHPEPLRLADPAPWRLDLGERAGR